MSKFLGAYILHFKKGERDTHCDTLKLSLPELLRQHKPNTTQLHDAGERYPLIERSTSITISPELSDRQLASRAKKCTRNYTREPFSDSYTRSHPAANQSTTTIQSTHATTTSLPTYQTHYHRDLPTHEHNLSTPSNKHNHHHHNSPTNHHGRPPPPHPLPNLPPRPPPLHLPPLLPPLLLPSLRANPQATRRLLRPARSDQVQAYTRTRYSSGGRPRFQLSFED